jgi:uncharacterized membrane protein YfcA
MFDGTFVFIAAVFALAGFVKGTIGLGLPTITMGLLAVVLSPLEAAAILIVPSLITNIWQMISGPSLHSVVGRLWPMMVGVCLGTWTGMGLMTGAYAQYGTPLLGVALALYALIGLAAIHVVIQRDQERIFGPLVGAVTGIITAATGVFVIPAVPYLQAIGLEKDDLVQALGLSFTVSTFALAVNVGAAGILDVSMAGITLTALAMACLGMWFGQALRQKLSPTVFRRWFFIGLLLLGIYLVVRSAT